MLWRDILSDLIVPQAFGVLLIDAAFSDASLAILATPFEFNETEPATISAASAFDTFPPLAGAVLPDLLQACRG